MEILCKSSLFSILTTYVIKRIILIMKTLAIRDFPAELQKALKIEAAKLGISLRDLVIRVMREYLA